MLNRVLRCTGSLRSHARRLVLGYSLAAGLAGGAAAQSVTSAFTYQGQLGGSNGPINGTADLIVTLFNAQVDGAQVGPPNTLTNVAVADGHFTASLDFGVYSVASDARWLEIAVRSPAGSGAYTTLTPRQRLAAAPVAWYAMRPWRPTTEGGLSLELPTNLGQVNGVGIGTGLLMPAARLHVRTGAFSPATAVHIEDGFARSQLRIGTPESEGRATLQAWNGQTNAAGPLSLNMGGGNVGVGTNSPSSKLDVAGSLESDSFKLNGNGAAMGRVLMSDETGVATWQPPPGQQWTTNGSNIGYTAGSVGIGTTSPNPSFRLHLTGGSGAWRGAIAATGTTNSAVLGEANGVATVGGHNAALSAWSNLSINPGGGNVGIGTITPDMALDVRGTGMIGSSATFGDQHAVGNRETKMSFGYRPAGTSDFVGMRTLVVPGTNGCGNAADIRFDTWECQTSISREIMRITGRGNVGIGTTNPVAKLDVAGVARCDTLQIDAGADVAENYDIAPAIDRAQEVEPQPGMLVSINPREIGKLIVSSEAYDRRVAGVVSGAADVRPGLVLSQPGTVADGAHPVASMGRVWCWADADANGSIEAGDLLTTSTTPGHAMSADDSLRAGGATIGKAMSPLKSGRGLVLVLVSLQ